MSVISCKTILFIIVSVAAISFARQGQNGTEVGFSVSLYQRDSPGSPLYNPDLSQTERLRRAVSRSAARITSSSLITPQSPVSGVIPEGREYLMKIYLGTPGVAIFAVADTGSDMTWTQCEPCYNCYPQSRDRFDSRRSSSFHEIPCGPGGSCPLGPHHEFECNNGLHRCHHAIRYGDGTYSNGLLSYETMTMGSVEGHAVRIPHYVFGCGKDNGGNIGGGVMGVIGLGSGAPSLISQLGERANRRFSYCLIPLHLQHRISRPSTLHFGANAVVAGAGVVRTPLVPRRPAFQYHVTLEAFTIGRKRLAFTDGPGGRVEEGNIIVDSGSSLIGLSRQFYAEIRLAVTMQVRGPAPVPDPDNNLDLCYPTSRSLKLPSIAAHFRGGDVVMNRYNAFVDFPSTGVTCFAFGVSPNRQNVYGGFAQQNFLVGFDMNAGTVSFKPADCANH